MLLLCGTNTAERGANIQTIQNISDFKFDSNIAQKSKNGKFLIVKDIESNKTMNVVRDAKTGKYTKYDEKKNKILILFLLILISCNYNETKKNKMTHRIKRFNNDLLLHKPKNISFVSNKSFKYEVLLLSNLNNGFIRNEKLTIIIDKFYSDMIKKTSKSDVMKLLKSENSDFATNVILYYTYGKGYVPTYLLNNEEQSVWKIKYKQQCIKHWKENLHSTTPPTAHSTHSPTPRSSTEGKSVK